MFDNYLRLYSDSKYDVGFIASIGIGQAKLKKEILLYGDFGSGYTDIYEKDTDKNSTLVKKFGLYFRSKTGILKKFEVSTFFISHEIKKPEDKTKDIKDVIKCVDGILIGLKYNFNV